MNRTPQDFMRTSRRNLLKAAGGACGMMTNTSLLATLLNLQATKSLVAATDTSGYKALVCLFLNGGNDSYNMLIPNEGNATTGEYGDYYSIRGGFDDGVSNEGGLAIEQSALVPIVGPQSRSFGLHPGMAAEQGVDPIETNAGVAKLYNDGNLAFVCNIGAMSQPTTRADYDARVNLPLGLFSHADLQRHWQTSFPQSRNQVNGWGGRLADLLSSTNGNPSVSMNISVSGMNLFQTGVDVVPYAIGTGGATQVYGYVPGLSGGGIQDRMFTRAFDNYLNETYSDLLAKSFSHAQRDSTDAALAFNNATNSVSINTDFADESPSNHLKMIARVIGARQQLGQGRQIFFVNLGGWDNHTNLLDAHMTNLPRVSRAIKSFYDAMVDLEIENDVTLFTASDFARTLSTNGQGSDHAWGGHQIVCGGAVNGGTFYGDYPELTTSNNLNIGRGRLIPTMSVDQLAAEIAMWFGVGNDQDLETILPNIREFYASSETQGPLGLFS
ncbi:DUF1501 domain-containing protein [Roseiconus lacunae]|uniref:DUF1501 domain-containing protein n=1 Tax=Roseiconus lacunae TaxID=2605694 RepID=UPI0030866B1C|nr:DUF1501 domain-containing protein [Stieleria sp. HD01]